MIAKWSICHIHQEEFFLFLFLFFFSVTSINDAAELMDSTGTDVYGGRCGHLRNSTAAKDRRRPDSSTNNHNIHNGAQSNWPHQGYRDTKCPALVEAQTSLSVRAHPQALTPQIRTQPNFWSYDNSLSQPQQYPRSSTDTTNRQSRFRYCPRPNSLPLPPLCPIPRPPQLQQTRHARLPRASLRRGRRQCPQLRPAATDHPNHKRWPEFRRMATA